MTVMAQRLPLSCFSTGGSRSPTRSRYAIHGRSTAPGAAGHELLHHRLVRRGVLVRARELGGVLAAEELHVVGAPEADVRGRLDDQREADLRPCRLRLLRRTRMEGTRDREADRLGGVE